MNATATQIGTYTISGFNIPLMNVSPSHDVRFMSQKALFALATAEAYAELVMRADIIRSRAA